MSLSTETDPSGRNPVKTLSFFNGLIFFGLVGVLLTLLYFVTQRPSWTADSVTILALTATLLAGLLIVWSAHLRLLGFVGIYFLYLSLAHLGAVGTALFAGGAFAGYSASSLDWLNSYSRPYAVALSGLGIGSFVLGAYLVRFPVKKKATSISLSYRGDQGLFYLGSILLLLSSFYMLFAVATGRLPVLGTYIEYRSAAEQLPNYSLFLFCLAVGLTFALATGTASQIVKVSILFLIPTSLLLISGNRGEILYPVAAGVAILHIRGYRPRLPELTIAAIGFFVFIPLIAQSRNVTSTQNLSNEVSLSVT